MARPTLLTPELQAQMVALIERGVYPEVAAQAGGIDRTTYYRWMREGRDGVSEDRVAFRHAIKKAQAIGEVYHFGRVSEAVDGWQTSAWVLERTRPERYALDRKLKLEQIKSARAANRIEELEKLVQDLVAQVRTQREGRTPETNQGAHEPREESDASEDDTQE